MDHFGELDREHRLYARYRCLKLMLGRTGGGFILKCAGRFENLAAKLRLADSSGFVFPDFLIIGAQKSGTSSMTYWLQQLPEFNMAMMKVPWKKDPRPEIQFFSDPRQRVKGMNWYSRKFVPGKINGEKCPEYLPRKSSMQEIHRFCPGAKLIVMLRNPVTRAFSGYQHYAQRVPRNWNWDWLLPDGSFEENLRAEELTRFPMGILARGRYVEQLVSLVNIFPEDQLKIIVFERFVKEPEKYLQEVVGFLGGSMGTLGIDYVPANKGTYNSDLKEDTRRRLAEYYKPYNEKLFKFLGYRIEEWRQD